MADTEVDTTPEALPDVVPVPAVPAAPDDVPIAVVAALETVRGCCVGLAGFFPLLAPVGSVNACF
jgi:hypothetical protein